MRRIAAAVAIAAGLAAPAEAEIAWYEAGGSYELKGADLFKLRAELPDELEESLKAIRNVTYADEETFRNALTPSLLTGDLRAQWTERLVELAAEPGGSFGVEPRDLDLTTIYVEGPDPALDTNLFTGRSWLNQLPLPDETLWLTTAMEGNCLAVSEKEVALFRLCQPEAGEEGTSVTLQTEATHVVGLGQEFQIAGDTRVKREGFIRRGFNVMSGFNGGANGNTLFPVAYFDLPQRPFALVLDNRYQQEWDLSKQPYRLRVWGGDLKIQVLTGDTMASLRRQVMDLTGHPPVPPRQMFGLWLSEYGFEDWAEVDDKIATLKAAGFPLSGIVLDLFWFGGIESSSTTSRMGTLTWDETRFPDPAAKIAELQAQGIGTMLIEESYVSSGLPEHAELALRGGLAHNSAGVPAVTNPNGNWWGKGGMIDWTSAAARAFWHDYRRQALIDMGVMGHWTDLGEPEMISPQFRYGPDNLTEAEVHQSYNVLWVEGIFDGYRRNAPDKRSFMMSRSGGLGMQAYGAAMWSGDTGGDYGSLAAQMPQQTHMMWSGLDYYGSDIGGFHRGALGVYPGTHEEATDELYTQWLAYSALFEVPVRPHTENLCNCKETAPDRIGDVASNLANLRLRYALLPYYYSLAHRAWLYGAPIFPSLDYAYPDDPATRGIGHVKMIGNQLLGAAVAANGATEVEVYLPQGDWYDFRTGARTASAGETFELPVYRNGLLTLPLFAKDGAIVPMEDGVLRVFGSAPGWFDWIDDDGTTTTYQEGAYDEVRVTLSEDDLLTLVRTRGTGIVARTLVWTRTNPVTRVFVNGIESPFAQDGTTVTVALPTFDTELSVAVE